MGVNVPFDPRPVYEQLRDARRAKGLKQSDIAVLLEITQAAISRYESGKPDALSKGKVEKMAKHLGVEIDLTPRAVEGGNLGASARKGRFCVSVWCPSCLPFILNDRLCMYPTLIDVAEGEDRKYCDLCGEPLQEGCPGCGSPYAGRAFCVKCGAAMVAVDQSMKEEILLKRRAVVAEGSDLRQGNTALISWQHETVQRLYGAGAPPKREA